MSGHEVELKFEIDAADVAAFLSHPLLSGSTANVKEQSSTYFDTPEWKLRKGGFSLRVRRSGGTYVQTIKGSAIGAGLFDRPEWETVIAAPEPDFDAIKVTPLRKLLTRKARERLQPVVTTIVERTIWLLENAEADVEVALDRGSVSARGQQRPLNEVEIEIKRGTVETAMEIARALARQVPLRLGVLSKVERGYALADGSIDKVFKASPVEIGSEMSVAEAFALVARACLKHFHLNEDLLVRQRDPGALHQARVAMRRLRSALSLFRPALLDEAFHPLVEELRWFTGHLGEARNLDVFMQNAELDSDTRERLSAERERAYDEVISVIQSQRFRSLIIEILAWTETGRWRQRRKARAPIRAFAERRLGRLWQKVEERGGKLVELEEEERHRLRIDIKKLRYAAEFMAALYVPAASGYKPFVRELEKLQEQLGLLNDMATARSLSTSLEPAAGAQFETRQSEKAEAVHLAAAEKAFRKLTVLGPFWR